MFRRTIVRIDIFKTTDLNSSCEGFRLATDKSIITKTNKIFMNMKQGTEFL
jgi:hypothetical protein